MHFLVKYFGQVLNVFSIAVYQEMIINIDMKNSY